MTTERTSSSCRCSSGLFATPLLRASSATANNLRRSSENPFRAMASDASLARNCGAWSSAIKVKSSAVRLTASARRAFTCQAMSPIEKATATAAAIQALVVEFKIISFPLKPTDPALIPTVLHLQIRDERRPPDIHGRPAGVLHRSILLRFALAVRAHPECPRPGRLCDGYQAPAFAETFPLAKSNSGVQEARYEHLQLPAWPLERPDPANLPENLREVQGLRTRILLRPSIRVWLFPDDRFSRIQLQSRSPAPVYITQGFGHLSRRQLSYSLTSDLRTGLLNDFVYGRIRVEAPTRNLLNQTIKLLRCRIRGQRSRNQPLPQ